MTHFEAKKFSIPTLSGISEKTITEHLKLYEGYVKHANLIIDHIEELSKDSEKYAYELGELQRRFGFEFDGMRNHEYYFGSLEGGATPINTASDLYKALVEQFGTFDAWLNRFKAIALTRGIGWAMLYYDTQTKSLQMSWIDEQHLGQLVGLSPVLALDMWEHSYVMDYMPSGKKTYVEDFFKNLNWKTIEANFTNAL